MGSQSGKRSGYKINGPTLWSALSGRKEQRTMDSQRNEHLTQAGVSEGRKATGRSHLTEALKNLYLSHLSLEAWRMSIAGRQNSMNKGPASGLKHRPRYQADPTQGLPPGHAPHRLLT